MLLKYFYDQALAHASYMVGCQQTGEAIIIDPSRDIQIYLEAAHNAGMEIMGIAETHIHADYVSGARELAYHVNAKLFVSDMGPDDWKYAYAEHYPHLLLREGDSFFVGKIKFEAMHTPGHTPESISFLLTDLGGGADQPMGIFTGDFIFVGSIGRPDLLEEAAGIEGTAETGARDLYRSVQRFRQLPDYLQVWPAHGAGSACGKGLGSIPSTTVGYEKMFNPALQFANEQAFVDYILAEQPEPPKYFALMKHLNKVGPQILGSAAAPKKMALSQLAETLEQHLVIDTARGPQYADGHVPGTINIEPKFIAMWGGSILDYESPIYLISDPHELPGLVRTMREIGLDNIAGYFAADEVIEAGLNTQSIPQVPPREVSERMAAGLVEVIDVRRIAERNEIKIPHSTHQFLGQMLPDEVHFDPNKTYAFQCRTGGRSIIAASIAQRAGAGNVINLEGGMVAWESAKLPVESQQESPQPA
ncbi:MAG: MBL fold metallo-hydrolase [Pirellulaceae bacterium]|nr:MBL fold metallo-hydrolase [Pirellulaceae bacterium]